MSKAAIKAHVNADVTLNGVKFTLDAAAKHVIAVYDLMALRNEEQIDSYKEIGDLLIQIESICGGDKQRMGKKIQSLGLDVITAPDRSDARYIASNWTEVQKLRHDGKIDGLGVSAIRKRIKALKGESTPKPKAGKGEGKAKAAEQAKPEAKPEAMTEADLAKLVVENIQTYGLSVPAFVKALQAELAKG